MRNIPAGDGVSRRRLLHSGAASLALMPSLVWAQGPPPPPADDKIATLNDAAQRLTVNVSLNGKGPFSFVVDTGADRTVIAEDIAAQLGLVPGEQVMVQGVVRTVPSRTVPLRELSVGPVLRKNLTVPILPRNLLQADGYLGLDAIDGYRVTLDFRNHVLEIGEPRADFSFFQRPQESRIPVYGRGGHLRSVDCFVGGVRTTAFLDTGAAVSVGNVELFNALYDRDPGYGRVGVVSLSGVTGGSMDGGVTLVDRIKLKDLMFSNCSLVIADLQIFDIWDLAKQPALLIGMNILRQFARVSIDYGTRELRFDLASLAIAMKS